MLWTPQGQQTVISNVGIVGGSLGTSVVSNATTLLDGAVTELIPAASNVQESWGIYICVFFTGAIGAAAQATMDILIGGATDDVLIESLIVGHASEGWQHRAYLFPVHVPSGVRLAATHANVRVDAPANVLCYLYGGEPPPFRIGRKVTTYGTKINNARGKAVVPTTSGGAASVTEMTASTSEDHFAFLPGFQPATDSTLGTGSFNIGIGIGASVEERIGTWSFTRFTDEGMNGPLPPFPAFRDVPAGTRLTMLASNPGTNDAAYDGLIYAVS